MAHQIAVSSSPLLRAVKEPAFPKALLAAAELALLGAAPAATLRRRRVDVVPAVLVLAVAVAAKAAAAAALDIDCAASTLHLRLVALSFAQVETTGALAQKSSRASIMSTR